MPWKESSVMDERMKFIGEWLTDTCSKSTLCSAYGISRPTGDKWIARYAASGAEGLLDHSSAPCRSPQATPVELCNRIIDTKLRFQHWGPRKVVDWLRRHEPTCAWPVDSTVGEILRKAGLVRPRDRRRRAVPSIHPFAPIVDVNQSWSMDFKGDFRLGNGCRCYPLTMSDNYSRYVLACQALERPSTQAVRPWCEWVFREYGLPVTIRTDNGSPFASLGLGGISQLSKWWIELGIIPERIAPGKPAQNGRHERMHRTLKHDGVAPIQTTISAQQRQFDRWQKEFNEERSHEALGRQTPASVHHLSPRPYPAKVKKVDYDSQTSIRHVRHNGQIRWRGELIYLSETLCQEPVGLKQVDETYWEIRYSFYLLGYLNSVKKNIISEDRWLKSKPKV